MELLAQSAHEVMTWGKLLTQIGGIAAICVLILVLVLRWGGGLTKAHSSQIDKLIEHQASQLDKSHDKFSDDLDRSQRTFASSLRLVVKEMGDRLDRFEAAMGARLGRIEAALANGEEEDGL